MATASHYIDLDLDLDCHLPCIVQPRIDSSRDQRLAIAKIAVLWSPEWIKLLKHGAGRFNSMHAGALAALSRGDRRSNFGSPGTRGRGAAPV